MSRMGVGMAGMGTEVTLVPSSGWYITLAPVPEGAVVVVAGGHGAAVAPTQDERPALEINALGTEGIVDYNMGDARESSPCINHSMSEFHSQSDHNPQSRSQQFPALSDSFKSTSL